jgi:hypothetical protein
MRPPVLDAICARALAMTPDERQPTAALLEGELQQVLAGEADSHARTLGRVVTHAFAAARAEREAMIAGALGTGAAIALSVPPKDSYWTKESDWTRTNWAREVDAFLSAADDVLDVTVVDTSGPPEPPPEPEPRRPVPPPPPPPARNAVRRRVGGAVAALVISGGVLAMIAAEMQRPAGPQPASQTAQAAVTPPQSQPVQAAATPPPVEAPPPPAAAPETTPAPSFGAFGGRPSSLPPSLVADELSTLRLHAERLGVEKNEGRSPGAGHRHRRAGEVDKPAVETSGGPAPSVAPPADNLRPAALRAIDEGNPYK